MSSIKIHTRLATNCKCCGATLIDPTYIAVGYGRECIANISNRLLREGVERDVKLVAAQIRRAKKYQKSEAAVIADAAEYLDRLGNGVKFFGLYLAAGEPDISRPEVVEALWRGSVVPAPVVTLEPKAEMAAYVGW